MIYPSDKESYFCCGTQLDSATLICAFIDITFGTLGFTIAYLVQQELDYYEFPKYTEKTWLVRNVENIQFYCIFCFLVGLALQGAMGVILCGAIKMRSRSISLLWIIIAGATAIFGLIVLRIVQILVVYEFYRELGVEQSIGDSHVSLQMAASPAPKPSKRGAPNFRVPIEGPAKI